ncbi:hypothetical protein GMSM_33340 [Geomonas sp. Red276]
MTELTEDQKLSRALRSRLRELCATARRDALVFAVSTVLLTPVAFVVFIFTMIFAFGMVNRGWIEHLVYRDSFLAGVNLCLAFMGISYFLRPKEKYLCHDDDNTWAFAGMVIFCVILAFSYLTRLPVSHAGWFWSLYLILAMAMLGCLGKAYEPHDDYYIGWVVGPYLVDNPFTLRDDLDRAHISLGFAGSVANLILESYGALLGSRWLWRGLAESELNDAVIVVRKLALQDFAGATVHIRDSRSAADIIRALSKLELVMFEKGRLKLTFKGVDFVSGHDNRLKTGIQ